MTQQKIELKREKRNLRLKKLAVFFLVFFGITGITTVDAAYSDMMGTEGILQFHCRRLNDSDLSVSFLGMSTVVDTTELEAGAEKFGTACMDTLEWAAHGIAEGADYVYTAAQRLLNKETVPEQHRNFEERNMELFPAQLL